MAVVTTAYRTERAKLDVNGHRPPRTPILTRMAIATATFAGRHLPRWRRARSAIVQTAGLACVTVAAGMVFVPLGVLAAGLSLLVLDYLVTAEDR